MDKRNRVHIQLDDDLVRFLTLMDNEVYHFGSLGKTARSLLAQVKLSVAVADATHVYFDENARCNYEKELTVSYENDNCKSLDTDKL